MNGDEKILICTHATFRFAYEELKEELFNNTLIAIDDFIMCQQNQIITR